MAKYSLVNYFDVWGNPDVGWEVNNQCVEFEDLVITDDATDDDVLDYLVDIGFLTKEGRKMVTIDNAYMDAFEVVKSDDWMPVCALVKNAFE